MAKSSGSTQSSTEATQSGDAAKAGDKKKKRCFVIGPIGEEGTPERIAADWVLEEVVRRALEPAPFGYEVMRADDYSQPGQITFQIIRYINEADLIVADFTDNNANAFYELAIAHTIPKPVVHLVPKGQKPPFDVKDYRSVYFGTVSTTDYTNARRQLQKQVTAIESPGYEASNPIIDAVGLIEFEKSADPKDKLLAETAEKAETSLSMARQVSDRLNALEQASRPVLGVHTLPQIPPPIGFDIDQLEEIEERRQRINRRLDVLAGKDSHSAMSLKREIEMLENKRLEAKRRLRETNAAPKRAQAPGDQNDE